MALREAAHHRLFGLVPWLRQQLIEAVDAYGRGISIDGDAISAALNDIDPTNPESLQNALTGGLFEPQNTEAQNAALRRLETLLALIEGWVDAVVSQAAGDRMPNGQALTEAVRRRRASGGPAEQTFATLVGLELRPRRLRDAAQLWAAMYQLHGTSARDGLWSHPDLLPTTEDLDDPMNFAATHGATQDLQMPELDDPDLAAFKPADDRADTPAEATAPAAEADATRSGAAELPGIAEADRPDTGEAEPDTGEPSTGSPGSAGPPSESGESQADSSGS